MRLGALAAVLVAACGHPGAPAPARTAAPGSAAAEVPPPPADAPEATEEERLAAIQKAMNELDEAVQGCWAAAAVERFDIEGELVAQIDIGERAAAVTLARDTARNARLSACVVTVLTGYRWAPPLYGQTIRLPFKFRAPDGQSTIDRALVPWAGQGAIAVSVLLDENNSNNDAASMLEVAIAGAGTTGRRLAERTELWYFLGPAAVDGRPVAAGDMAYVRPGVAREISAPAGDVHAVLVLVPGGREGTARAGALPTREVGMAKPRGAAQILPAAAATRAGPALVYAEDATTHDRALAASILALPAGAQVAEHVHAGETELLYMLEGSGTLTVAGVALPVGPTSVIQVPKATKHAFTAAAAIRAVQIYTPAGPEQRFKKK